MLQRNACRDWLPVRTSKKHMEVTGLFIGVPVCTCKENAFLNTVFYTDCSPYDTFKA